VPLARNICVLLDDAQRLQNGGSHNGPAPACCGDCRTRLLKRNLCLAPRDQLVALLALLNEQRCGDEVICRHAMSVRSQAGKAKRRHFI